MSKPVVESDDCKHSSPTTPRVGVLAEQQTPMILGYPLVEDKESTPDFLSLLPVPICEEEEVAIPKLSIVELIGGYACRIDHHIELSRNGDWRGTEDPEDTEDESIANVRRLVENIEVWFLRTNKIMEESKSVDNALVLHSFTQRTPFERRSTDLWVSAIETLEHDLDEAARIASAELTRRLQKRGYFEKDYHKQIGA